MTWKMRKFADGCNPAGGKMEKWIAYPESEDKQITVQPTWGRGRIKGKYEVLLWEANKNKSKILGNYNTFIEGIETAKRYIESNKEHKKLIKV